VEIDIYADAEGGRYGASGESEICIGHGLCLPIRRRSSGLFQKPGFKVIHAQDIDYRSNCRRSLDASA